jgi:predicted Zn-dependent peptidase
MRVNKRMKRKFGLILSPFSLMRAVALALCLAVVPLCIAAQATDVSTSRQASSGMPQTADLQKQVTEFDVNGLKVLVKRRPASQTVVAGLFIKGGARNVTAQNAGIESLMLDVETEASQNYPLEKMRRELAKTGTQLSNGINLDYSAITLGSTLRFFDRSWDIFTDAILHPSFTPEDFQRVKNRTLANLSDNEDTPDSYLQILQARSAYAGHPYLNDPKGTVDSIGRLTVDDVRKFHQQVMQTSQLLLVVVGDVDPLDIRKKVEASLGKLPVGNYKSGPIAALSFSASTVAVTPKPLPTNYVQGVFAAPSMTSDDIYAMRVASAILQSKVYSSVRVQRNLSYAPDAFLWSQAANLGGIYVTAVDANEAVRLMLQDIKSLQTELVDPQEVRDTAQQFLTRYYLGQETNAAQAGDLAQFEIIGGGWRNSFEFLNRVRAVTPADIERVAQKYMKNIRFVVIGDPSAINKDLFVSAE